MTGLPDGSVVITPNEMYREMQEIAKKVDHVATILDPAVAQIRVELTESKERVAALASERELVTNALDSRVRALENWRWFVLGVAAVFGPAGGYILTSLIGGGV